MALLIAAGCAHTTAQKPSTEAAAIVPAATNLNSTLAVNSTLTPAASVSPAPDLASNSPPAIRPLNINLPTLFIAGDSTAARGRGERQQGWAVPFADYFDLEKVNVANAARAGRSSRTFITEGLWDQMLAQVKPRDIVLIQFGHNDGGPLFTNRARGSLPGLGEETQEGTLPNGKSEVVHTFGWYMRKLIADVKAKGATPIVLSLTIRNMWRDGKIERGSGRFSQWSYDIAKDARVPFVDVTTMMADQFDAMGEQKVTELYPQDHTHFNAIGADMHAAVVVSGLKGLRPSPITGFLSPKGQAIAADRFSWLRLPAPANPRLPSLVLVGDSTVRNGRGDGGGGQWGWGDYLGAHFDLDKINVVNRAVGGTGVASFMALGHWDRALALLKPGDFVMIQFGHNDNGARGPLPGVGENTQERQNAATGQMETVHTFGWYLKKYIADARAEGATPIVCSLVPRKIWKEGKIARNKESHAGWAEQVAAAECAALVDLNEIIARRYDELGPDKVNPLFADEHTHTTADGAKLSAECVVAGLKGLTDDPLKTFLREEKP